MRNLKTFILGLFLLPNLVTGDTPPQVINKTCSANQFFNKIAPGAGNITCAQPAYSGISGTPSFIQSLNLITGNVSLVGDSSNPGNSKYYGTDSGGTKGYFSLPVAASSVGTIDSQVASSNGAVISGGSLVMQSASATAPGLVNTTAQTFAGAKTFSSAPAFSAISNGGTVNVPTGPETLVGRSTTDTLSNKTLTAPVIASIVNTGTLTLPTTTDTLVGRATTDTLTNKTLTSPVIGTIINTGTLLLPTSSDTLVGRATLDTLTNKTISGGSNTLSNIGDGSLSTSYVKADGSRGLSGNWNAGAFSGTFNSVAVGSSGNTISGVSTLVNGLGTLTLPSSTDTIVGRATTDTLTNKTISGSSNTLSNIADGSLTTSYLKADGTRALSGDWNAGAHTITANSVQVGSAANTVSGLSTIVNSGTLTLPTSTDTIVGRATTDTLTNKTLTAPVISTISNTGTLTLPTSTDTLIGRATTDTLTNKTLNGPNGSSSAPTIANSTGKTGTFYSSETQHFTANQTDVGNFSSSAWTLGTNTIDLGAGSAATQVLLALNTDTASNIAISGGTSTSTGSNIRLYGSTHASKANRSEFYVGNTTVGGYDASGRWSIGVGGSNSGTALLIDGTTSTGGDANQTSVYTQSSIQSAAAGNVGTGFYSDLTTQNTAFTLDQLIGFYFHNRAKGAASTITREVAFGGAQPTQGARNAFMTDSPGGFAAGNWFLYESGSNANFLNGPTAIGGTTTNDNASTGFVGEYVESVVASQNAGTTATWTNLTSISITAGDWDCTGIVSHDPNGASMTNATQSMAVSTGSGATTTDHVIGSNVTQGSLSSTSGVVRSMSVSSYRVSIASTTSLYLKTNLTYTVATPLLWGRESCRRMR